ncbi:hypothetical protein DE146DRAFT_788328 [Phaeosphaeria sp. MPI-PUGE-AT-0046c]|nr:hypothetical protein DE146DRAFT_788328 [Phaeosphaeria sp. MPI-PUGE-AT-0046c]
MRFTATLVALAALVSVVIAGKDDPCSGRLNQCKPNGALKCAHHSQDGGAVWFCRNGCWSLQRVCKGECINDPEPHCPKN